MMIISSYLLLAGRTQGFQCPG